MVAQSIGEMAGSEVEVLLFDLDDTLYRKDVGIWEEVHQNINEYLVKYLNVPPEDVKELTMKYYVSHGTTLAGLISTGVAIDANDWHERVHLSVDYPKHLQKDDTLRELLLSLPQEKWIFTNADVRHAEACLACLGIRDCFKGVIAFEQLNPECTHAPGAASGPPPHVLCKPSVEAFNRAMEIASVSQPQRAVFFDDSPRNVQGAKKAHLHTVLVGADEACEGADVAVEDIRNLASVMPGLWLTNCGPSKLSDALGAPRGVLSEGTAVTA